MKNKEIKIFIIFFSILLMNNAIYGQNSSLLVGDAYQNKMYIFDLNKDDLEPMAIKTDNHFHNSSFGALDSLNKLLYYTNGCHIFNGNHDQISKVSIHNESIIDNYCNNYGSISSDNVLLLPSLEDKNTFFLLATKAIFNQITNTVQKKELIMSVLDTKTDEISNEHFIHNGNITSVNYTLKEDGNGYWIIFADIRENKIFLYNLEKNTINLHQKLPFPIDSDQCKYEINIKFSNFGNKIAFHHSSCYLSLYDFDNCNGNIVGPRTNLLAGSSDVLDSDIAFSQDDKHIILGQEVSKPTTSHTVLIYETSAIGIKVNPKLKFNTPANFSLGKIFATDSKVVVFNRFEDSYFIDFRLDTNQIKLDAIHFRRLPFRYTPSFSKMVSPQTEKNNNCISSALNINEVQRFKIFPNPVLDILTLNGQVSQTNQKYIVNLHDISGTHISSFIYNMGENIDVSNLKAGNYVVQIISLDQTNNNPTPIKFIKQ